MATAPIPWREPESFSSGDTLIFNRNLPNYLPSDGWSIHLTISKPNPGGAKAVANAVSAPDPTNAYHTFNVANFCGGLDGGVYLFSEEVVNGTTGEKHQVFYSDNFLIGPDLGDGLSTVSGKTEAEEMLCIIRATLKDLYKQSFVETDVQRNRFVKQKLADVLTQWKYWKAVRQQEIQNENVRNGLPSGATQVPVFQMF